MTSLARVIVLMIIFSIITIPTATAQEDVGFSLETVQPDNQRNDDVTYFDLMVEPGEEQNIDVIIHNHEDEELTVNVSIFDASTNSNGLVVYEQQEESDETLEEPVSELVVPGNEEVVIPAGDSATVTSTLTMPDESFDGIKLGGIYIEKDAEGEAEDEGVNIQNRYAYVVGFQLQENEEEVTPELDLSSVGPELVNYSTSVVAELQNKAPVHMKDMDVTAAVTEEDGSEPLGETEMPDIEMAPNSTMDVVIDWGARELEAGTYELEMQADYEGETWEWNETFTVEEDDESLNDEAVGLEESDSPEQTNNIWPIVGFAVMGVVIIGLIIYILRLRKKK